MPPPGHHRVDWEAHRSTLEDLYVVQGKPLSEVIEIMKRDFNLDATTKMYKKRIKAWGMFKNINGDEMLAMIRIKEHRHRQGKRTRFYLRGKPVLDSKLRRFANRHGVELNNDDFSTDVQPPTRGITFSTPEPDDHLDTSSSRLNDTLHPSPVISNADSTFVECSMGSPNPEPRQLSSHDYQSISWDMSVPSPASFVAQDVAPYSPNQHHADAACIGPTTQQVHAWLDDGYISRFDDYNYPTGNVLTHSTQLEIGYAVGSTSTARLVTNEQQLELRHAVDRYPNSLDLEESPFHQVQLLSWDRSPFDDAVITSVVTLPTTVVEDVNPNLTAWDGITGLHHTTFQHGYGALVLDTDNESINYAGHHHDGDELIWPN